MNSKGQMGLGVVLATFIGVLVGLVLFTGSIAGFVGDTRNTEEVQNTTVTIPAVNSSIALEGSGYQGTVIVYNSTNYSDNWAPNVTVTSRDVINGVWTVSLTTDDDGAAFVGESANVSYTAEPDGYITTSGGRAVAGLILIFVALAIALVALSPTLQSNILDRFGR